MVVGKVHFLVVAKLNVAKPLKFGLLVVKKENMVVGDGKKKKAMGNDDGKEVEMSKDSKRDERVVRVAE